MAEDSSPNEISALATLVTLSRFAANRTVARKEIQRQLQRVTALVPDVSDSAAGNRFRTHEGALRKFLSGAATKHALAEELGLTQDFLALGRP
jgi:hypothetical protein